MKRLEMASINRTALGLAGRGAAEAVYSGAPRGTAVLACEPELIDTLKEVKELRHSAPEPP